MSGLARQLGPDFESDRAALSRASVAEVLQFVESRFGKAAAFASSFSVEDVIVIHEAATHAKSLRIFTLDTGRLPVETYELIEVIKNRYGVIVETYFPNASAVEALVNEKGHFSFRQSLVARHECCAIRKVEPLSRALKGAEAWLTGLRREQSPTRTGVDVLERDQAHGGIFKLNPLANWTETEVWSFVKANYLPYNALYDKGYRSIGCAPCTRALKPYEEQRAGRWWWEDPEHKECGIHLPTR